ncbi:MAG: hypothetical protein IPL55_01595 [Saprospiraceae bacterium]|nr:hypothetical protein [Saprospiraceae bacterium]
MKIKQIFTGILSIIFLLYYQYSSSMPLDSCFIGKITVQVIKQENDIGFEFYTKKRKISAGFRNQIIDEDKLISDYKLQLTETKEYFIKGDTLIVIRTNLKGDTLSVYAQIKNQSYFRDENQISFTKMNIAHGIELVKEWVARSYTDPTKNKLKAYIGNQNQSKFRVVIDPKSNYIYQSKLPYNFAEIFFKGSFILEKDFEYSPHGKYDKSKIKEIVPLPINCLEIMQKLSFSPDENEKPMTVNRIFYEFDTVIMESNLRPKPYVNFYTRSKDSISMQNMPGDYKYVAFVHGKYNKKKLREDFQDLSITYQSKNIRFYIIEMNENITNDHKLPLKGVNMDDITFYYKRGREDQLFKKLGFFVYPIYFLFDKEGKIVLVQAPPPADPNLCSVLDRLE